MSRSRGQGTLITVGFSDAATLHNQLDSGGAVCVALMAASLSQRTCGSFPLTLVTGVLSFACARAILWLLFLHVS